MVPDLGSLGVGVAEVLAVVGGEDHRRVARDSEAIEGGKKLADLLIGVDARGIALHDLTQGEELLRRGRAAARASLPAIRALL